MTKTYRGQLFYGDNGEDDEILAIGDGYISELIADDINEYGRYLSVRYWITDIERSKDELTEDLVKKLYGSGSADYGMVFSEATGYLWTNDELRVGGHDLLAELTGYLGKWLHLEIDYSETPKEEV